MIRVMLVDDHALVRMGFRMLLEAADMAVVGEAESGEQAFTAYPDLRPDVILMDLSMPGAGGLESIRRLALHDPQVRILALTALEAGAYPHRAFKAGALGYLSKRGAPGALIDAVRTVAEGRRYLDAEMAQRMAMAQISGHSHPSDVLSEREFAVFLQLAKGLTVAQIAVNLNVAASTVGTHLYNIKQKFQAANQAELTLIALQWDLIQP